MGTYPASPVAQWYILLLITLRYPEPALQDYTSFLYCLKDAVALADAPDMYAFFSESFQLLAGQVVEISDLIHLDDEVSAESSIKIDLT